jgi:hypothetical protein
MDIREVRTNNIQIRELDIPPVIGVFDTTSQALPYTPPVVVNIGAPIVDIPGCVETRETEDLREVDPRGNMVLCDGGVPSYSAPNFEPNQKLPTPTPKVDTRLKEQQEQKEKPDPPGQIEIPNPAPPSSASIQCPTAAQAAKEPVGTYVEGFRKKVTEYKLIGNQCIQITEKVSIPEQVFAGLPSGGQVMQTGGIAAVATASALMAKPLADILLKVVKPTVKKVMKKIAKIRGKELKILSVEERREEQRDRNQAIAKLKSVKAKVKKKG